MLSQAHSNLVCSWAHIYILSKGFHCAAESCCWNAELCLVLVHKRHWNWISYRNCTQYIVAMSIWFILSVVIFMSFVYVLSKCFHSLHGRRKVHDYFLLLLCKSSIPFTEKHIFKIIIYFFNASKCAANYVISFEVDDGFMGQKILKLWRQESWQFGPGWAANITQILLGPSILRGWRT